MNNLIPTVASLAVLGYIGYIAIAPTSADTLNRLCEPVFSWPKIGLVAGARVFSPSSEDSITRSFNKGFSNCRAWGWGAFYQDQQIKLESDLTKAASTPAKPEKTPQEGAK